MATTITPIAQTITTIPTAGHRGVDSRDIFVTKQEAFQDTLTATTVTELNSLKTQINTTTGQINTVVGEINTDVITSTTQAGIATTQAGIATTQAGIATTQAGIATTQAGIATTAANDTETLLTTFENNVYIRSATPPASTEALWFDITANIAKTWDGSIWKEVASAVNGTSTRAEFIATALQTTFSINYEVGFVDVYLNGLKLSTSDFVATNGTSIVLNIGATAGDLVSIIAYGVFEVANTYTKAEVDTGLATKQATLVSGTNIKTVNGASVLGAGNITLDVEVVLKPIITTPTTGAVDYIGSITSSAYALSSTYKGTLDYVEWQLATDVAFTNIVHSKNDNLSLSYTPQNTSPTTEYFVRVRYGSDNHLSNWSDAIGFTTPAAIIYAPTITSPTTGAIDLGKNVAVTSSTYAVFGHSEPHASSDWQIATDVNFTNIVHESLNDTTNKISWTTPNLTVSTTYYVRVKYKSTSYSSAYSPAISFTTKALFTPLVGTQGDKGFGVAPTDQPFALLGLAEMTGTNTVGHDNYGNYIHTNGSIVCWCPKAYYRVGNASSPRYATYGANALDIVGTDVFETEAQANAAGYVLHRAFINAGAEKAGFFIDKYMNSKDGTTSSKSVFGGVPISLSTTAGYTVSNGMTGCTGILADAVVLSKTRGTRWNTALAFQYAWLAMVSVAQGQAATSTANCAWYDATLTTNFPKGCNNNALSDTNDTTVTYLTAGDSGNANKPKTGATANFAKTTHNGSNNGVADLNGGMYEVSIGITYFGTTATSTTAITNDTIYTLKTTIDHASLTGGWNGANDVWGDSTNLATKYNAVTSPHPLGSATGTVYWGNGANAIFPSDATGVNRDICGFIPKNSSASNATGINMMGNDYLSKYNVHNMVPLCCGNWSNAASAGLFCRHFGYYRSGDNYDVSFRASAYFA